MSLTDQQIWILGIVAVLLVQAYKIIKAKYTGVILDKKKVQYISMLVSLVLAVGAVFLKMGPVDFSDPVKVVTQATTEVANVFGLATAMYLILFKQVADALGLNEEKFLTSKD